MSNGIAEAPATLTFRCTPEMVDRLERWKAKYAKEHGVNPASVSTQFALPYLMNEALTAGGVPPTDAGR